MSRVSDIELQVAAEQKCVGLERYRELFAALSIASNWMVVPSDVPAQQVDRLGHACDDVRRALDNARLILGGRRVMARASGFRSDAVTRDVGSTPTASTTPYPDEEWSSE